MYHLCLNKNYYSHNSNKSQNYHNNKFKINEKNLKIKNSKKYFLKLMDFNSKKQKKYNF